MQRVVVRLRHLRVHHELVVLSLVFFWITVAAALISPVCCDRCHFVPHTLKVVTKNSGLAKWLNGHDKDSKDGCEICVTMSYLTTSQAREMKNILETELISKSNLEPRQTKQKD